MWIVYALLSAFFAALTAIFAKVGVQNINSNLATAIRTIVVLILIWSIVLFRGEAKDLTSINKYSLTFLILSGLATGFSWIFYFKAIQTGNVSQVALIDKLSVVLTLILAAVFLGEPFTLKVVAAMALIVSGVIVLIW
jgi:transporter family protein